MLDFGRRNRLRSVVGLLTVLAALWRPADAEPSKLVKIACSRNPELSFCSDGGATSETKKDFASPLPDLPPPAAPTTVAPSVPKTEGGSVPDLLTFEEHLEQHANDTDPVAPGAAPFEPKSEKKENAKEKETKLETPAIPDDPILSEPLPSTKSAEADLQGKKEGETKMGSEFGSLLRLPRPRKKPTAEGNSSSEEESEQPPLMAKESTELVTPPPLPRVSKPGVQRNEPEFVDVYVTKFCVDRRKDFLLKCRGNSVNPKDIEFCKSYPLQCQAGEEGVVPLLAYCERFIHNYVKVCAPTAKRDRKGKQFCKAYDQFCVPPPTPADLLQAEQSLTRCEDIQAEARKVCNPPPPPSDRLNSLRCSQFFKFCAKFVDWQ